MSAAIRTKALRPVRSAGSVKGGVSKVVGGRDGACVPSSLRALELAPSSTLDASAIKALSTQRRASRMALPLLGPATFLALRAFGRYRIANLRQIRQLYRLAIEQRRPTMVCANHLTMIDSLLLHYALGSAGSYILDFRRLGWNVAAAENFFANPMLRTIAYLGKTLPIDRNGAPEHHRMVLDQVRRLLSEGDVVTLFPEGTRSRSGTIEPDAVTYGVGRVLKDFVRPLVVCVYLRGRHQIRHSTIPEPHDEMYLDLQLLEPETDEKGLRAGRAIARQIIDTLKSMEQRYFDELARAIE